MESQLTLLETANDPLFWQAFYDKVNRLDNVTSWAMGANSSYEAGTTKTWYVEEQRSGADLIEAGVILKDQSLADRGWRVFDWAFAKQAPDGSFRGTGDPFHSTAMFLESVARCLLLQKQSGDPRYPEYRDNYLSKLDAAARWMMIPEVENTRHKNDDLTHRRYLEAAVFGMTAELTGDQEMERKAEAYAKEGLSLMTPEGINPEKGGFDISYQNFGILLAERYYTVCKGELLRKQLADMINKGLTYALTKVKDNGDVISVDSTRVGLETDRTGSVKTPAFKSIIQAFEIGSKITGQSKFQEAADRIAKFRYLSGTK